LLEPARPCGACRDWRWA